MKKFGLAGTVLCTVLVSCQATNKTQLSSSDEKVRNELVTDLDQSSDLLSTNLDGTPIADLQNGEDSSVQLDKTAVGSIKPVTGEPTSSKPDAGNSVVGNSDAGSFIENGIVQAYVAPKKGTIFTWRNNWASLPEIIAYRADGVVKFGNKEFVKFTSTRGLKKNTHAYYDMANFSLKGYRDAKNSALVTYKPAEQRYKFPMKPGDKWVTSWESMDHTKKQVTKGGGVVKVIKFETLKIGADKYDAVKVKMPLQRGAPKGMTHYVWFSPKLGITIKEQIGSGAMNWTQVLESVQYPS